MTNKKRFKAIDYLRGMMALSIVIYHFSGWSDITYAYPFNDMVDRLGIYAVAVFYVLSGISLTLAYSDREINGDFAKNFFVKRITKIIPVFYVALTITIVMNAFLSKPTLAWDVITNYSLLFGWINHNGHIATGTWYIGNQIVFYSIFPILLWLIKKSRKGFLSFWVLTIMVTLYFSFYLMSVSTPLSDQFSTYTNPINQLFFFAGGIYIGWDYKHRNSLMSPKVAQKLLAVSLLVFIFLPTSNGQIDYVTGYPKIVFSIVIFIVCLSAMSLEVSRHNKMTDCLNYISKISYSLFLMHPISYRMISVLFTITDIDNKYLFLITASAVSLVMSSLSYVFLEKGTPFKKREGNKEKMILE